MSSRLFPSTRKTQRSSSSSRVSSISRRPSSYRRGVVNPHQYDLRWFTPTNEIDLCGHATLASALVLLSKAPHVKSHFHTRSGVLTTEALPDGSILLELPDAPPHELRPGEDLDGVVLTLLRAISVDGGVPLTGKEAIKYVGRGNEGQARKTLLLELDSGVYLERIEVNPNVLMELASSYICIILTADVRARPGSTTFVCRVFAPVVGIPEDPVTGFAYSLLGPYWHQKLHGDAQSGDERDQRGSIEIESEQVSQRRGFVVVEWNKDRRVVKVRGKAVVVAKGEMFLSAA